MTAEEKIQDNLTWMGQDEKSLPQKILIFIGGIASFGALFPVFVQNLSRFFSAHPKNSFLWFCIVYFILPIAALLLWLVFSGRLKYIFYKNTNAQSQNNVVDRYDIRWLIAVQKIFTVALLAEFVLGICFLCASQNPMKNCDVDVCILVSFVLVAALSAVVLYFIFTQADTFLAPAKKIWYAVACILTSALLCWLLSLFINRYTSKQTEDLKNSNAADTTNPKTVDQYYSELLRIDTLQDNIKNIDEQTRNITERFRIKSMMAWGDLKRSDPMQRAIQSEAGQGKYHCLSMAPYLIFLNELMLADSNELKANLDSFLTERHISDTLKADCLNDKHFFEADTFYAQYKLQIRGNNDPLAYLKIIDSVLYTSLSTDNQLIKDTDTIFRPNKDKDGTALAAYFNLQNSTALYQWMENFIAYSDRKTQESITGIKKDIAWIWRDAQIKGIIVFAVLLITLLLYYFSLYLLMLYYRKQAQQNLEQYRKENTTPPDADLQKKWKDNLQANLQIAQHYIFPVTTFIAIIIALIIPLTKEIKAAEIDTSKPGWFTNLPNWYLPTAVAQATQTAQTDPCNCTTLTLPGIDSVPKLVIVNNADTGLAKKIDSLNNYFGSNKINPQP
jgi:hypothetical protein